MNKSVGSAIAVSGNRSFAVTRGNAAKATKLNRLSSIIRDAMPNSKSEEVNRYRLSNLLNVFRGFWRILVARVLGISHSYGAVYAKVIRGNGQVLDMGLVSLRVVTTAGVNFIVDAFQNSVEVENMKYHGFGIGTTAESSSDTALVTELTTEYTTNSTRPTGSQTEGAANVYRTVATLTPDSGGVLAITEHGVFSQAATGGGVLLDRSKFAALNLDSANGDSLQITYDLTLPAGS